MSKQMIEPYEFQCKTNIEEHNDIVNKVNEIVDAVNGLDVEEITKDISALESEVSAQGNEIDAINTEIAGLPTKTEVSNGDITAVAVDKTNAGIEIQLTRPAGVLEDSVSLPFINTATLIPASTERAFKIRFTYTDGTQYDTNEFVIPEGGGTDVSVTGVTVEEGTAPNSFKVAIQLSDASTIASNDYEIDIPAQQNTYPTSVSGTLSGTTLTLTIGLNNSTNVQGTADLSAFLTKTEANTTYATKTEVTAIGVTSEGNNVSVNGKTATIVKSVSGQVTDGKLKITVNGVESGDIPLPKQSSDYQTGYQMTNEYKYTHTSSYINVIRCMAHTDMSLNTLNEFPAINCNPAKVNGIGNFYNISISDTQQMYFYTIPNDVIKNIIKTNKPELLDSDGQYYMQISILKPYTYDEFTYNYMGILIGETTKININNGEIENIGERVVCTKDTTINVGDIAVISNVIRIT